METEARYVQAVKSVMLEEYASPSSEFVRFFAKLVYPGISTQHTIEQFAPIVEEAFKQFVTERIDDQLITFIECIDKTGNKLHTQPKSLDHHFVSDEEFEGYFVVNVA